MQFGSVSIQFGSIPLTRFNLFIWIQFHSFEFNFTYFNSISLISTHFVPFRSNFNYICSVSFTSIQFRAFRFTSIHFDSTRFTPTQLRPFWYNSIQFYPFKFISNTFHSYLFISIYFRCILLRFELNSNLNSGPLRVALQFTSTLVSIRFHSF